MPKIHREITNIGQPGRPSKPILVEKGGMGLDPNVTIIKGPVPSSPRHDPNINVPVLDQSKGENQSGNG